MVLLKKKVFAVLSFWALILFGPALLAIWNALSFYRIEEGTLLFLVFTLLAQPISAWLAVSAAEHFCPSSESKLALVNTTIAAALLAFVAILSTSGWKEIVSDALTEVVLIWRAVSMCRAGK